MSPSLPELAVTGATGAVGGLVARALADQGVEQRLVVRRPDRAPDLSGAVVVQASYGDHAASLEALRGVRTLFMVSASEAEDRLAQHLDFVDAAADAGVQHIVYTSFAGAAPDCTFTLGRTHYATEQRIREHGISHTFLRDNFYLDVLPYFVDDQGLVRGPAGDGRVAAVARADVARVATTVLRSPGDHVGATYDVTGREALTLTEVADTIARVTGREARYLEETLEEAYESRRRWPAEQWQYDAWVSTYTSIAAGEVAAVSDDVERLTGRLPLTLEDHLRGQGT